MSSPAPDADFILTDANGAQTVYYGNGAGALANRFKAHIDPNGNETTAVYNSTYQLELLLFTSESSGVTESAGYFYSYYSSGAGNLQLATVTYRVNGVDVRRSSYRYYDDDETGGNFNDLKTATIASFDSATSTWADLSTSYYRYYVYGEANGFPLALKFVVGPEGYARMVNAGLNPETASDEQVALYADNYFEYVDRSQLVALEATNGGSYVTTFSYDIRSSEITDYNVWLVRTIETLPDGSQNIVYCNFAGQVMLKLLKSGEQEWGVAYFLYDDEGRGILRAEASAVESYDESLPGLVTLNETSGLIHTFNYYSDDPGPTGAPGYFESEGVQEGSGGDVTLIRSVTYATRAVGDASIYRTASSTFYQSDASGGSDPATTSYSYEWYSGSFQLQQMTTTLPIITSDQNGSGLANASVAVYDTYGRLTWAMDENGVITYTLHDVATGGLIQRIDDVNTTVTSGAPSGWSSPSGMNLISDYEFDLLGRNTQSLGPVHATDLSGTSTNIRRATWTVYQDALFQVWQGNGYATGTAPDYSYTLINPVQITQFDQARRVTDQIQAVRSSGSGSDLSEPGALLPTDELPQSGWSRWKRSTYDDKNNLISECVYFDIPAEGEGGEANYNQTSFGYDVMDRQNRVVTPGGTITRTVYNPMGWVVSVWVGTNDAGATDSDPSGGGAPGNNMVVIVANQYDGGVAGGDGNLTQVTQYQDSDVTRVTSYGYDYRDRRIYTDGEIDFYQSFTLDNLGRVIQVDQYDTTASGNLVARSATKFDLLGRVFQTLAYAVDPSTGTVGNALTSNVWYDPVGNQIKSLPAGSQLAQKTVYDALRRPTVQYASYLPRRPSMTR